MHLRGAAYGFCSILIGHAQRTGVSAYVGDGSQRWPAVNRLDAARLFCLAPENATPGTVLHAVGAEGDTMRSLAETIGAAMAVPVESVPPETFGVLGGLLTLDQPSSGAPPSPVRGGAPTPHPARGSGRRRLPGAGSLSGAVTCAGRAGRLDPGAAAPSSVAVS
ncbi:MAG TPA: hypothetical protein VFN60_07710 [Acidimicrobiales bacterium]|nr:hypothetical protein [Acidimicrobiales bacterium]